MNEFSRNKIYTNHRKVWPEINGKQNVEIHEKSINVKLNRCNRQIISPFVVYG